MNTQLILKALNESYSLICEELDSVCNEDLIQEYKEVLHLLEQAIGELEDGSDSKTLHTE